MPIRDFDLSSKKYSSSYGYMELIHDAPKLGFYQLTVQEAANIIAWDRMFVLNIASNLQEAESKHLENSNFFVELSKQAQDAKNVLVSAINFGSLKTTKILRNFQGELDVENTLIDFDDLEKWLVERGHVPSDGIDAYLYDEEKVFAEVVKDIYTIRKMRKSLKQSLIKISCIWENPEKAGIDELRIGLKNLFIEHTDLKENLAKAREDTIGNEDIRSEHDARPLTTRKKRTLLTLIAALCKGAGINHQDRGAAQRIGELTEEIGAPVTDDTIRSIISDIDDAVETRMR